MIIIFGLDGLEYEYVKRFMCSNLMQSSYGKTDISEFKEPRTIVIWSSFLAGKNLEKDVLALGKNMWDFRLDIGDTFFSNFKKYRLIDVPGYNFNKESHFMERRALKEFFDKKISVEEYDKIAFDNYNKVKKNFFRVLDNDYDIVMVYFNLADIIGHLSFGIVGKMRLIYKELDRLVGVVKKRSDFILVISDHGMRPVGRFGDHNLYGFWSLSFDINLGKPKITDFYDTIVRLFLN